jgi:hypothetical protein
VREGFEREQAFDKVLSQPTYLALPRKFEGAFGMVPRRSFNVEFKYMKSYRHEFSEQQISDLQNP